MKNTQAWRWVPVALLLAVGGILTSRANYNGNPAVYIYDMGYDGYDTRYATEPAPLTSPVGAFAPNGYGLHGMAGNVHESVFDWYPGWEGNARMIRGGSWGNFAENCRVGSSAFAWPGGISFGTGFRAVLPPGSVVSNAHKESRFSEMKRSEDVAIIKNC